jgi:hypothetical protein
MARLRPADGQAVTHTAPSRNSAGYQQLLATVETASLAGDHRGDHRQPLQQQGSTRTWLLEHPRIRQVFIPKGACCLNLQEGWWLFRR